MKNIQKLALGLLLGTFMTTGVMAQDVVMRRPIPMLKNGGGQDCTVTNTCPPDLPDGSRVAYGYALRCPITLDCYRATYVEEVDDVVVSPVDASFCQSVQTPDQIQLLDWAGLVPGGPGFNAENVCNNPNTAYLWYGYCNGAQPEYICGGFSESAPTVIHPDSTCENYIPQPEHEGIIAMWVANGMMTNEQKIANPIDCGQGGGPGGGPGGGNPDEDDVWENGEEENDPNPGIPARGGTLKWKPGPWRGNATCGEIGTLRRSISCVEERIKRPPIDVVLPEDYEPEIEEVYVSNESCRQNLGMAPISVYTGRHANCNYELEILNGQEWFDPNGGDPTCSETARLTPEYRCMNAATREEVSLDYCQFNLNTGQEEKFQEVTDIVGNFEGCTAQWTAQTSVIGCFNSLSPSSGNGPVKVSEVVYVCRRSDGRTLSGSQAIACEGEQPATQMIGSGSCFKNFNTEVYDGICWDSVARQVEHSNPAVFQSTRTNIFLGEMGQGGAAACVSSGATCCQTRYNMDLQRYETVGSTGEISRYYTNFINIEPGDHMMYLDDGKSVETKYGSCSFKPNSSVCEPDLSTVYWYSAGRGHYVTMGGSGIVYTPTAP